MAVYADREAFIPYRKADVVELCIEDGKLNKEQAQQFREFCEILGAYYHFNFHKELEDLKNNFAFLDPDADTKPRVKPNPEQRKEMEKNLVESLSKVLEKANYQKLAGEEWEKALQEESLITLKMNVDENDFDEWILYHRGDSQQTTEIKKMFGLKKIPFTMNTYDRVVMLIKFKDEEYFLKKFKGNKKKLAKLNFTPGRMYIYMYKNIPKADLEVLFPNVEIRMNLRDKLFLGVPAVGAGIPVLLKILPNIIIIGGIIALFFSGKALKDVIHDEGQRDLIIKGLIAGLSGLAVLGGFVFRQYVKYKNKRILFLKQVTDTLFFKSLVCNAGVFNSLIDAAEDEECKEVYLAYYHLLTNKGNLTQEQLDNTIEEWLEKKFNTKIDFAVEKALEKMQNLKGKVVKEGQKEENVKEIPLLWKDKNGACKVLPLDDGCTLVDYIWDNIFKYNAALD